MAKYYVCNEIQFLDGLGKGNTSPSSATHYKMSKAANFIRLHPDCSYVKVRSSSKGNDYVICTKIKLVGANDKIVDTFQRARQFSSVDEAYEYIDANRSLLDPDVTTVIDDKFNRKRRPSKQVFVQPIEKFEFDNMDTSERIVIPQNIRSHVYDLSDGTCAICGNALSKYNYTIDHIIPLSRGGTNSIDNLRATHESCNKLKGKFTDGELLSINKQVFCNALANNISTDYFSAVIRSFVRGINKKYKATS